MRECLEVSRGRGRGIWRKEGRKGRREGGRKGDDGSD